tara:strand:+ start:16903 stop:17748 length:846 start_codon:yes stop_codon:yes gene_type:complete
MPQILVFNTDKTTEQMHKGLQQEQFSLHCPVKRIDFIDNKVRENIQEEDVELTPRTIKTMLKIVKDNVKDFTMAFFGSGDFHHLTLFMLQERKRDFFLIMFDHHYDVGSFRSKHGPCFDYDCCSWMYSALWLPKCKGVILVGPNKHGFILRKVQSIKYLKKNLNLHVVEKDDKNQLDTYVKYLDTIPKDCDIYVTIDKDVLTEKDLLTDFDGGSLTVQDMFTMLSVLIKKFGKRIVSADVCGDPRHTEDYKQTKLKDVRTKHLLFNQGIIKLFNNYLWENK